MSAMKTIYRNVGWFMLKSIARLLWSPVPLAINLVRFWTVRRLLGDSIVCRTCRQTMSLLGLWECGTCGWSFYGFYFARCEVCGSVPPYLECDHCGASSMNPMLFG